MKDAMERREAAGRARRRKREGGRVGEWGGSRKSGEGRGELEEQGRREQREVGGGRKSREGEEERLETEAEGLRANKQKKELGDKQITGLTER